MIERIPIDQLKLGMYVNIPDGWVSSPFFRKRFLIKSKAQIRLFRAYRVDWVNVDTEKSLVPVDPTGTRMHTETTLLKEDGSAGPGEIDTMELVTDEVQECLNDPSLPPNKRASVLYNNCIDMMSNLLDQPTALNIAKSKAILKMIADHLLLDEDTASYLYKIAGSDYDQYTHAVNVGVLSLALLKKIFDTSEPYNMNELAVGFFLHDLGKCSLPGEVVTKPDLYTDNDLRQMKKHPGFGYEIMHQSKQLSKETQKIILQHHEIEDGSGYPQGLRGNEIHIYGRICRIADTFDALTSKRPYKSGSALPPYKALQIMKDEMVNQYNSEIFKAFVTLFTD